jgi:hypothetical protein
MILNVLDDLNFSYINWFYQTTNSNQAHAAAQPLGPKGHNGGQRTGLAPRKLILKLWIKYECTWHN